jgi:hypothetical protein
MIAITAGGSGSACAVAMLAATTTARATDVREPFI